MKIDIIARMLTHNRSQMPLEVFSDDDNDDDDDDDYDDEDYEYF